jgi:hypothetical protein
MSQNVAIGVILSPLLGTYRMPIRAALSSDSIASVSGSTVAVATGSPVLALCRKLVEIGYPSSAELEAYRDDVLSLKVRSIGEAAQLEATEGGFRPRSKPGSAPLVSHSRPAAISLPSSL